MKQIKAKDLIKNYKMEKHEENGIFIECNEKSNPTKNNERPSSGFIYYYVSPGEKTQFHKIDCDEYWSHNAGSTLEIWTVDKNGNLNIKHCGTEKRAEPTILFKKGEIFASKLPKTSIDGSFITCITVPRFNYEGFKIIEKEEIIKKYPKTKKFWD